MEDNILAGLGQTPKSMLEAVNQAIVQVLIGGQVVKLGSRTVTRADVNALRKLKAELEAQVAQEGTPGLLDNTFVAVFDGR
ncbi:MAG: peptidylprolyl isomerase [Oscillospiraceae bacterium]|nr:peptidylprolyl isomerase [Oscillospiraceae bacterium]